MAKPVAGGRGGVVGLAAGAGRRHRDRVAGLLRGLHRQAGARSPRRPACRSLVARHGAVVAADRGGLSRARFENAHPVKPSPKPRAKRRRTISPRSRKATWPTAPPNCSRAPAGFPPCCGPHSRAADDTGSGGSAGAGDRAAGSGNRAGSSGAVDCSPGRFAALIWSIRVALRT